MKHKDPTIGRQLLGTGTAVVDLESAVDPTDWNNRPGIEGWTAWLSLRYDGDPTRSAATIARAYLYRVYLGASWDFVFDLDNMTYDLGYIAGAIREAEDRLIDHSIAEHMNTTILIATDVVVDKVWRGHGLGPALVFHAADALRAEAVFGTPVALPTRLDRGGECVTDYELPRPRAAQPKVERAWRKAGFRKLAGDVIWLPTPYGYDQTPDHGALARHTITQVEDLALRPQMKAWWRGGSNAKI